VSTLKVLADPLSGSAVGRLLTGARWRLAAADVAALWRALFAGRLVAPALVAELVRPRSDVPSEKARYGLGFWLHPRTRAVVLEGADAGVSCRSVCDPEAGVTHTVLANWTDGAWPLARYLAERLTP